MAVSKRTRYEVLRRDNHTCRYCHATDSPLTVDHVTPVALGGSNDPSNLVAACKDCNAGKSSSAPDAALVEDVRQIDIEWASAMQQAGDIRAADREKLMSFLSYFRSMWGHSMPWNWESSLEALYRAGISRDDVLDAICIAQEARGIRDTRFVYFCGVAWKRVRKTQEIARSILAAEETGTQ